MGVLARGATANLTDEHSGKTGNTLNEAAAVFHLAQQYLRYTTDPLTEERIPSPSEVISANEQFGRYSEDCDGFATFVLSMLHSLGHKVRATMVGFQHGSPDLFSHVFCETQIEQDGERLWVVVDPSLGHLVGEMANKAVYQKSIDFEDYLRRHHA